MGCRKRKESHGSEAFKLELEDVETSAKKKRIHQTKSFKLIFQLVLTAIFFVVELIVGYVGNSMALVADSFHMLSDVISLAVGLLAVRMAQKRTSKNTFGWVRAEVLGALVNSVFLLALCFSIFIESIKRLVQPEPVEEPALVLCIGIAGLVINIIGMIVFSHHHSHDHGGHHHHGHGESHDHRGHHHHSGNCCRKHDKTKSHELNNHHNQKNEKEHHHHHHNHRHHAPDSESLADVKNEDVPDSINFNVGEKHEDTKDAGSGHESLTSTSDTYNSSSALNNQNEETSPIRNTIMSAQLTSPSFTCYFCRNSIPAASRIGGGGNEPDSCENCGQTQVIILPANLQTEVRMNGIGSEECSDKTMPKKTCRGKTKKKQLKESAFILLQTVPTHIQIDRLQSELLEQVPSIKGMHELHVWQLAGNRIIASAHVHCQSPQEYNEMATAIKSYFHDLGIHSTTIQPEFIDTQSNQNGGNHSVNPRSTGEGSNPSKSNTDYQTYTTKQAATGSVVGSNMGSDNRTCLLMCGPEKSCGDQELCCPRDKLDQLRKRQGISRSEYAESKLPNAGAITDASPDISGIPIANTNVSKSENASINNKSNVQPQQRTSTHHKTPQQVLRPTDPASSVSQISHSFA